MQLPTVGANVLVMREHIILSAVITAVHSDTVVDLDRCNPDESITPLERCEFGEGPGQWYWAPDTTGHVNVAAMILGMIDQA